MSLKSACQQIERKDDHKPWIYIILPLGILAFIFHITEPSQKSTNISKINVVFENKKTICFQSEDLGTWCVEKGIKDRY
jgi:hypothetical protein